jgi:two-component system response regulator MprA
MTPLSAIQTPSRESQGTLRILVVEDDAKAAQLLRRGLTGKGHATDVADDALTCVAKSRTRPYDAIVLDIMFAGPNGITLIRNLRTEGVRVPIMMLTACDSVTEVVRGLDAGADDYLTKPFSFDVLAARLAVIARRTAKEAAAILQVADLTVNTETLCVRRGRRPVALTRTEFALLEHFMRRAGRVVMRDEIIEAVWGFNREIGSNTLDVFILQLRSKLEFGGASRLIQTVRGFGYRMTTGPDLMGDR